MRRWMVLGASLASACSLPDGDYFGKIDEDPDPTHLRYCNTSEPEYIDPTLASSTADMKPLYALFDGLTDHDLQGLPMPSIATSWDISPDWKTFTFHLRDDAKWSNGRPITASDFVYGATRLLHPATLSKNAETLWKLENGELYTAGKVKLVTRDAPPFSAGDIVQITAVDGMTDEQLTAQGVPDPNLRTSSRRLRLRDLGAPEEKGHATVPVGDQVSVIELNRPEALASDGWLEPLGVERAVSLPADRLWAYVFWNEGDGVYGWVPFDELDGQPNAARVYRVVDTAGAENYRERGAVTGDALLGLPEVLGVHAPDRRTVVYQTWGPVPYFIDMCVQRAFRPTPREAVARWPKQWTRPEHIVTSGAFHLVYWRIRDKMELVKSKTYWGRGSIKLDRITIYNMDDQAANSNYYYQGSCDALGSNNIPASYLPIVNGIKRGGRKYKDYTAAPYLGVYIYLVNVKRYPNVHFRRALSLAVDRNPLPRILKGGQFPSAQFMPGTPISQLSDEDLALCGVTRDTKGVASIMISGKLCYVPPPGLDFDPDKAREEMAIARREMGDKFPKRFTVKFNAGSEGHKLIAEYLQQQWQTVLGLKVTLEVQEWKTFLKDTVAGEYDVARMGFIGNFPDVEAEFLPQFKCASPDNRTGFCDPAFEEAMKQAESMTDRKERLRHAYIAEKTMVESAPVIPLYVYTQLHLQKPYVRDLSINLLDQQPLRLSWIDPDWRAHLAEREAEKGAP